METKKEELEDVEEKNKKIEHTEKKEKAKHLEKKKEKPAINSQEYVDQMIAKKHRNIKIAVIAVIVILVLLIASTAFAISAMTNSKIISGITIDSVDVSGLDKTAACQMLEKKLKTRQETTIKIKYQDYEREILLSELGITSNIEETVDKAVNKGRDSNIFVNNYSVLKSKFSNENIDLNVSYNEAALEKILAEVSVEIPGIVKEYSYSVEDTELIITRGTDGIALDKEALKNQISNEITDFSKDITLEINIPVKEQKAADIDLDAIYAEVYATPKDAYIVEEPFQVVVDEDGIDFAITMDEAKAMLTEVKDEYIIPLKVTKAAVKVADLGSKAFPDRLSTFSTRYDAGNISRTTNLALASKKINGYVLQPGEEFSYNKVVGKRTVENGYQEAAIYANGGVVNGLGGGICQITSTLYNAVLLSNLEITERHNHSFVTTYSDPSRDATVVYGALDFKFKNSRKYPIKITSSVSGGVATISIYGLKENPEYTVKISSSVTATIPCAVETIEDSTLPEGTEVVVTKGTNGCRSVAYRYVYATDGSLVSQEQLSLDTYSTIKKVVKKGTKKLEEPIVTPSIEPTPEASVTPTPVPSISPEPEVTPTPIPSTEPVVSEETTGE